MKCTKCGYDNPEDSNYCMSCRAYLRSQDITVVTTPAEIVPASPTIPEIVNKCPHCNSNLPPNAGFCPACGKSIKPGGTFSNDEFRQQRVKGEFEKNVKQTVDEIRMMGISTLLPYKEWFEDKPWNLLWVRWFIVLTLFPLALSFWNDSAHLQFNEIVYAFGVYFAVLWAVVFYNFIRPSRFTISDIAIIGLFTAVVGIWLDLYVFQRLPIISDLYSATEANSLSGRITGFVFGVGIIEETVKALPLIWFYLKKDKKDDLTTIVFLGCISGFGFGISEAGDYSKRYLGYVVYGRIGVDVYLIAQLTRLITLPFLHAVWAGTSGYFIALASQNRRFMKGLLVGGLLLVAGLHGLYDVNADNLFGLAIAMLSILIFIAYIRSAEILQRKIQQLTK